jgi:hypothetical protein
MMKRGDWRSISSNVEKLPSYRGRWMKSLRRLFSGLGWQRSWVRFVDAFVENKGENWVRLVFFLLVVRRRSKPAGVGGVICARMDDGRLGRSPVLVKLHSPSIQAEVPSFRHQLPENTPRSGCAGFNPSRMGRPNRPPERYF